LPQSYEHVAGLQRHCFKEAGKLAGTSPSSSSTSPSESLSHSIVVGTLAHARGTARVVVGAGCGGEKGKFILWWDEIGEVNRAGG
jgi:hypothetical protein